MQSIRTAALTITAAVALASSGCGGATKTTSRSSGTTQGAAQGSQSAASGEPLSRAQLISAGNTICRRITAAIEAHPVATAQQYARALPQVAAAEQAGSAEMDKLSPPTSMAPTWQQMVVDVKQLAQETAKAGRQAQTQAKTSKAFIPDRATQSAFEKAQKHFVAIAIGAGFNDCRLVG